MNIKKFLQQLKTINIDRQVIDIEILHNIEYQRGNTTKHFPSDFTEIEQELILSVKDFTMTSYERLVSFIRSIDYIEKNMILGDIVECGVWKGGGMMIAALRLIQLKNQNRRLLLFDTFEGMSNPTIDDVDLRNSNAIDIYKNDEKEKDAKWCISFLDEVKQNLFSTRYRHDNIYFIKGKVEDTLPNNIIENIAILRLDTDWYTSTKHELNTLYDKLVSGGILIIDDYGHWGGARKAVDEFIDERGLKLLLNRVDYTCRIAIKP